MCGIYGFNWEDKILLNSMCKVLEHRGPDGHGLFLEKGLSLGHRRLAIIDLSEKGKQPMEYEHNGKRVVITFNGEIYNYEEIKKDLQKKGYKFKSDSDTEVILASYLEHGETCVNHFNGMWAFCIYDSTKKILFMSRDSIGEKPLYYYLEKDKFIFASEIKAILESGIKRSMNKSALNLYLSLRYIPEENTMFEGVKRLLAGHNLIFDLSSKKLTISKFWNLKITPNISDEDSASKKLIKLLEESVKKRLISDVPLGVYLSGGLDSSAIVALMHKIKTESNDKEEIRTFSVGFDGANYVNELPFAKQVSELFETKHKEIVLNSSSVNYLPKIIWHLDEPMADPALIPVYVLSKEAKKDVTVVLTGDGGDELFAGYDQYRFLTMGKKLSKLPLSNKTSKIMNVIPPKILDKFYKYSSKMGKDSFSKVDCMIDSFKNKNDSKAYYEFLGIFTQKERQTLLSKESFQSFDYEKLNNVFFNKKSKNNSDYLNNLLYFDVKRLLPENFLMKTDRMTMSGGIEGRVPLLDPKIAEFAFTLNSNLKLSGKTSKYIFKKSLKNLLPKEIIYRKKQSFHVPIESWVKTKLKEYSDSLIDERELKRIGVFNKNELQKIFQNYKKGELFYARKVWNLVCFKIWHDQFMN